MSNTTLDNLIGVNPLLSNVMVGVCSDQNLIAEQALTVIPATAETMTYRKASNAASVIEGDTETLRGLGAMPNEVDLSLSTGTVTLSEYMLGANVDYREEEAARVSGANPLDIAVAKLAVAKSKILLGKEQHVADIVFGSSNYTHTANDVDFGATGIRETMYDAAETVRKSCGLNPNTLVLGVTSLRELLNNADVKDMIKYSQGGVTRIQLLAEFFGVDRILVGSATKQTAAAAGSAGTGSYIWTADSAALICTNHPSAGSIPSQFNPSFGFLFQMPEKVVDIEKNSLITRRAYGQRYAGVVAFGVAGYYFSNTDQV